MTDLVFLDTETTGLDPEKHEVWEIALAVNNGPVQEYYVPHSIVTADPKALELNGYWSRTYQGKAGDDLQVRNMLEGNTLVCANPTFDRMMLRKRWGLEPYHYRSIDIESMALAVLQYERPKGLKNIAADLRQIGYSIDEPNHSAYQDVVVLRDCYKALRNEMTAYPRKVE